MARALVIGYGNPSRSDDGFGWKFAESLRQLCDGEGVEILTCQQLAPEMAETMAKSQFVVFADARVNGTPGTIHVESIKPAPVWNPATTHHVDPALLLAFARTLYGATPESVLVTVGAECLENGEELSAPVAEAMPAVLARVRTMISIFLDADEVPESTPAQC